MPFVFFLLVFCFVLLCDNKTKNNKKKTYLSPQYYIEKTNPFHLANPFCFLEG